MTVTAILTLSGWRRGREGSGVADREDPRAGEAAGTGQGGSDTDTERQAQQAGTGPEGDESQRLGTVFWVTVAISAAFVFVGRALHGDTSPARSRRSWAGSPGSRLGVHAHNHLLPGLRHLPGLLPLRQDQARPAATTSPSSATSRGSRCSSRRGWGSASCSGASPSPSRTTMTPPLGLAEARTPEAATLALQTAFFHWCLHPWAMYATIGVSRRVLQLPQGHGEPADQHGLPSPDRRPRRRSRRKGDRHPGDPGHAVRRRRLAGARHAPDRRGARARSSASRTGSA